MKCGCMRASTLGCRFLVRSTTVVVVRSVVFGQSHMVSFNCIIRGETHSLSAIMLSLFSIVVGEEKLPAQELPQQPLVDAVVP